MANTFAPFGFRQYSGNGSAPTYEQVVMKIASNNSTAIFFGDAVSPLGTGYIRQATNGNSTEPNLAGVFVGCKYLSTSQKRVVWSNYWPGSDATGDVEAYVVNDPNARFIVQANTGVNVTLASVNANTDLIVGTGNTATGISGMALAAVGTESTGSLPFRIFGLVSDPPGANGSDTASAANYVIVGFNNVATRNLTGI